MKKNLLVSVALTLSTAAAFAMSSNADQRAIEASLAHFNANARAYGLSNARAELKARSGQADELGQTHVRFDQYVNGVRVFEGEAISHLDANGRVISVTNALRKEVVVDTNPTVDRATAIATALSGITQFGASADATLEILPRGARSMVNRLVWHVVVVVENEAQDPASWNYFVDARTGKVVFSYNALETGKPGSGGGTFTPASGTGNLMYIGSKAINVSTSGASSFRLEDQTRGTNGAVTYKGNYTIDMSGRQSGGAIVTGSTSTFGDGVVDSSNAATAAAEVHYGLATTLDYYLNVHGRNGIDGNNKQTYSRVHYGRNYNNAFWSDSCFCMTYGDGSGTPGVSGGFLPLVSIDVAGHEMTHGVTSRTANLTYAGESGGLNEATSDIFGTFVEYYANSSKDSGDWLIGEMIYPTNYTTAGAWNPPASGAKALRYMTKPSLDGASPNCWSSTLGSIDVHYSSGPANHMMYLLVNGGASACNGNSISGIGSADAAAIWYRALTVYMTASTNYAGARTAALNAASDLFGASSAQRAAVAAAFSAINVN